MDSVTRRTSYDVHALREREFPWAEDLGRVYLNSAAAGPLPERTRRALLEYADRAARPGPEFYELQQQAPVRARRLCAELIGARPEEIALGFNTSFGINLAATALRHTPGDRVLLLAGDFPAVVYPWLNLERRGVRVEFVPPDGRGLPDEAAALERLARGDVRLFALSSVSFSTGYRLDLDAISQECRRHGTYLVVDGIQAVGALPVDVARTPVDILTAGGQKWLLSPHGSGFSYVRRELIGELDPIAVGWLGFEASQDFGHLLDYALDPVPGACRFELGSLAYGAVHALAESLSLLIELGVDRIERHVRAVQEPLIDWARSRDDVELVSDVSSERRSGIVTFRTADSAAVHERLAEAGITVSLREGAIRVSVHAFNCREEIERMIQVVERALRG
jgi:selenocysteine lyase/cysteine desulfurase